MKQKTTSRTSNGPRKPHSTGSRSRKAPRHVTHTVLERLMHYYVCLSKYDPNIEWISSPHLAAQFRVDDTQVRKDLALVGVKGRPNTGFRREQILDRIRRFLGLGRNLDAVIVGVGRLGSALVGHTILPTARMKSFIRRRKPRIAILACPVFVAQILAYELVEAGIRAIWNFSPTTLQLPDGVFVRNEHISIGLGEIAYHLLPS
jgi:redox-sensing transcriptional repressor